MKWINAYTWAKINGWGNIKPLCRNAYRWSCVGEFDWFYRNPSRPWKKYVFDQRPFYLVGNFNHLELGTIILIVFDFQGKRTNPQIIYPIPGPDPSRIPVRLMVLIPSRQSTQKAVCQRVTPPISSHSELSKYCTLRIQVRPNPLTTILWPGNGVETINPTLWLWFGSSLLAYSNYIYTLEVRDH